MISTVTDQEGNYLLKYDFSQENNKNPNIFLKVFKQNFLIESTEGNTISLKHDDNVIRNFHIETVRSITGKVTDHKDNPEPSYKIKVFNKFFGGEILLNETIVDETGEYTLFYIVELSNLSKTAPDIIVKLFTPEEEELIITPLKINADIEETFNFVVGEDKFIGKDKLSLLKESVDSVFVKVVDFKTISEEDVKVLASEKNISEIDLKYLIRAKQIIDNLDFTGTANLTEDVFFGLLKSGNSVDPAYFLTQEKSILREQLKDARNKNYINPDTFSSDEQIEIIINELKILAINNSKKTKEGEISLYSIFANTQIEPEEKDSVKDSFLQEYVKSEKIDDTFWEYVASLFGASIIEKIKTNLNLIVFSEYSLNVFNRIKAFSDLKQFAFSNPNWAEIVAGTTTFPKNINNEADFAKHLKEKIERAYPSQVINGQIIAKKTGTPLEIFLSKNPNFEYRFNKISFTGYDITGIADTNILHKELESIQRKITILPDTHKSEAFDFMEDNKLDSAHSIIKLGKTAFLKLATEGEKK